MKIEQLLARFSAPDDGMSGGAGADTAGADGGSAPPGGTSTPSIEDTARETFRAIQARGDDVDDGDEEEGTAAHHSSTQLRDKGKFAKAQGEGEQQPEGSAPEGEQQQQPPQAKPHDSYPNTWPKELSADWAKLPENARQQIHKREQDFHNGIRQYKDAAGFGQAIANEMLPYQEMMRTANVTPQAVVRSIMSSLKEMSTGTAESKASTFLKLADEYGIDLSTVMSLRQRAPSQAAPDLSPVLQRIEKVESRITQADQEREEAQRQHDDALVQKFLNDPKNEHARTVASQMSTLLTSGQAKDLDDAYQQAIWLHPEVRAQLLAKQEAERRKKEAQEATAARKASAANVTRRGTPPAPATKGSIEDTARAVYRRLNS